MSETPLTASSSGPAPAPEPQAAAGEAPVVVFDEVTLAFDDKVILDRVSFSLPPGRKKLVLGASGAGKSTILRILLGLLKPDGGRVFVDGERIDEMTEAELMKVRANLGMVFQDGALFDSLTVRENVGYRLFEELRMPVAEADARVAELLGYVGLADFGERMPAELSGGQRRRVAIARALASQPRILLFDEPTTGLDPITALTVDEEIVKLRDLEGVSSIMVTHQLRDAFFIATHRAERVDGQVTFVKAAPDEDTRTTFLMLRNGRVAFEGDAADLRRSSDPYLRGFLS